MEAKRIPGKPWRSKRERIEGLPKSSSDFPFGWKVHLNEVLAILDSPDEEPEPDKVEITMSLGEARLLLHHIDEKSRGLGDGWFRSVLRPLVQEDSAHC